MHQVPLGRTRGRSPAVLLGPGAVLGERAVLQGGRRTATLSIPNKAARIRLTLSKKSKRQLLAVLRRKKRVVLNVTLNVAGAPGALTKVYTKKVVVKRPRR